VITVKVEVTFDDILQGTPGACGSCPIALAAQRLLDTDRFKVEVSLLSLICLNLDGDLSGLAELPPDARAFIDGFDHGADVEPFEFEIELPDELLAVSQ